MPLTALRTPETPILRAFAEWEHISSEICPCHPSSVSFSEDHPPIFLHNALIVTTQGAMDLLCSPSPSSSGPKTH